VEHAAWVRNASGFAFLVCRRPIGRRERCGDNHRSACRCVEGLENTADRGAELARRRGGAAPRGQAARLRFDGHGLQKVGYVDRRRLVERTVTSNLLALYGGGTGNSFFTPRAGQQQRARPPHTLTCEGFLNVSRFADRRADAGRQMERRSRFIGWMMSDTGLFERRAGTYISFHRGVLGAQST